MVKKSSMSSLLLSSSSENKKKIMISSSSCSNINGSGIKKNTSSKHVNRGAWSAEEDKKLADYVMTHGDKRWRSLPSEAAGLNRCGKSCRLRWLNYLRPGIKRGNITEDEEDLIIRLHNLLGNRWSLIAGRLPGRTDNEIKNHWNTHLSKKSLTINELNLKLNQKLDHHQPNNSNANTNTPPSMFITTNSSFTHDWTEMSHPLDQTTSNKRDETNFSNPMNVYLDEDLDFNGLFDFSVGSDFPESDNPLVSSSELTRVQDDYNLLGEQMYHKYFDSDQVVVHGTSTGSLDEDFPSNKLDFEGLLYSDNMDDDVFLSFS